jgi:hypothetical protein
MPPRQLQPSSSARLRDRLWVRVVWREPVGGGIVSSWVEFEARDGRRYAFECRDEFVAETLAHEIATTTDFRELVSPELPWRPPA